MTDLPFVRRRMWKKRPDSRDAGKRAVGRKHCILYRTIFAVVGLTAPGAAFLC